MAYSHMLLLLQMELLVNQSEDDQNHVSKIHLIQKRNPIVEHQAPNR